MPIEVKTEGDSRVKSEVYVEHLLHEQTLLFSMVYSWRLEGIVSELLYNIGSIFRRKLREP